MTGIDVVDAADRLLDEHDGDGGADVNAAHATDPTYHAPHTAQFSSREAPWMRLGTVIDRSVTAAEAAVLGKLDFEVELTPVARALPPRGRDDDEPQWESIPNRRAVVRRDTGDVFDVVSADYKPVQYAEAFAFMDAVDPRYVAAGTLRGGRQGFMVVQRPDLATIDLDLHGEADPHDLFAVLRTSHDRSRGLEVALMGLRGRCMNQLPLSTFTMGAKQRWSVRHVGDPLKNLTAATTVFRNLEIYAVDFADTARRLADVDLLLADAEQVLKSVLPDRPRRDDQVNAIVAAWNESPYVGFKRTGWGLTNAVSEYFEWQRESSLRTPQSRFLGGLDGQTAKYVNRTAQLLLHR